MAPPKTRSATIFVNGIVLQEKTVEISLRLAIIEFLHEMGGSID